MREWKRAVVHLLCAGCGRLIKPGEPVLVFSVPGLKRKPTRCALWACAEEAVPPELPPLPARIETRALTATRPVQPLRGLALDFGRRLVGEREPGEDDE